MVLNYASYPYDRLDTVGSFTSLALKPGDVLLITPDAKTSSGHLINQIRRVREDVTIAVAVLISDDTPPMEIAHYATIAASAGARPVYYDGDLRAALYRAFNQPLDLPADIATWLDVRLGIPSDACDSVKRLCRAAQRHSHVRDLSPAVCDSNRTLRQRLSRAHLPSPKQWIRLVRWLGLEYTRLRQVRVTGDKAEAWIHHPLPASPCRSAARYCGRTPCAGELVGLEWRLAAWLTMQAPWYRQQLADLPAIEVAMARSCRK